MTDKNLENQASEKMIPGNIPIFETDLFIPSYKPGKWDSWEIKQADLCLDHGYVSGLWLVKNLPVLFKHQKEDSNQAETWMSPSAYEIESQEIGCRYCRGNTVVAGLGLGWSAVNAALLPQTRSVTVLELDPLVISIIEELKVFNSVEGEVQKKISVIQTDAMEWKPEQLVDFLYVDIWAKHGERQALDDVRKMQKNIKAKEIYFWGQEMIIYDEAKKLDPGMETISNNLVRQIVQEKIGLPLLIPDDRNYAKIINQVIANRISRGLPRIR